MHGSDEEKDQAVSILMDILEKSMRLMHPFLSFLTEEIYQKLPNHKGDVIVAPYPLYDEALSDPESEALASLLQECARVVRAARANLQIGPEKKLKVVVRLEKGRNAEFLEAEAALLSTFMGASAVIIDTEGKEDVSGAFPVSSVGFEAFVFVRDAIDIDAEMKRLEAELGKANALLEASEKKLLNENFISHAKPEAIEKEKGKKAEAEERIAKAKEHMALLRSF